MNNPLLQKTGLPLFASITPTHIEPAIDHLLKENRTAIQALLQGNEPVSWGNTLQPVEDLDDRLNRAWSPASLKPISQVDNIPATKKVAIRPVEYHE